MHIFREPPAIPAMRLRDERGAVKKSPLISGAYAQT
jgi:hypothetical protein